MLANIRCATGNEDNKGDFMKGVTATLGIAAASGFAAVYTEKVMKAQVREGGRDRMNAIE